MKSLLLFVIVLLSGYGRAAPAAAPQPALRPLLALGHFSVAPATVLNSWDKKYLYPKDAVAVVASINTTAALPQWVIQLLKTAADQILKAINIALQRLQNKEIDETNKAKIIESGIHASFIKDIVTKGNQLRGLYNTYYDELKAVKEVIVTIGELRDLVKQEADFIRVYQGILNVMASGVFQEAERDYILGLASQIMEGARANVADVKELITGFSTTMQDADRVTIIKGVNARISADLVRFRSLRNELAAVVGVRTEGLDGNNVKLLYDE